MTEQERIIIIESIACMFHEVYPQKDTNKCKKDMAQKNDYQLSKIFKYYIMELKRLDLKRPLDSVINQTLFEKIQGIANPQKDWNQYEECQDIVHLLSGWNISMFLPTKNSSYIPFFDFRALERFPYEKLLRILAVSCFYRITRLEKLRSTKKELGVSSVSEEAEILQIMTVIQTYFDSYKDYYLKLWNYPILQTWDEKGQEECFENLETICSSVLYRPKEKKETRNKVRNEGM